VGLLRGAVEKKAAPSPTRYPGKTVEIVMQPKSASAWFERGRRLERNGSAEAAREAYEKTLTISPGHFQAQNGIARLREKTTSTHQNPQNRRSA